MRPREIEPHPLLSGWVKCLWIAERDFALPNPPLDLLPDGYIELIINTGAQASVSNGITERRLPRAYLLGLLDKPLRLRADGVLKTVAARLYAWGLAPLFGVRAVTSAANRATDPVVALHVDVSEVASAVSAHMAVDNYDAAVQALQQWLLQRALAARVSLADVSAATQLLLERKGQVSVAELAAVCHLSPRQLERAFNATARISPKALAQVMRFEQTRDALWRDPNARLTDIAQNSGYADQAHFAREFKRFAQCTPRQFAADMHAMRALLAEGVAFVQDA